MQSPGHSERKKKKDLTQNVHSERKRLNQISPVSLSRSITLSPRAPLNSIKENSSAERKGVKGGLGFFWGGRVGREESEGKDFNIRFPHLKYINLFHPGALLKLRGVGGVRKRGWDGSREREKGVRVLMTFSLWNPVSIVSVVNTLPKKSTCHYGHTISELLNTYRWHYTLRAHRDDFIHVRDTFFCCLQYASVSK